MMKLSEKEKELFSSIISSQVDPCLEHIELEMEDDIETDIFGFVENNLFGTLHFEQRCVFLYMFVHNVLKRRHPEYVTVDPFGKGKEIIRDMLCAGILQFMLEDIRVGEQPYIAMNFMKYVIELIDEDRESMEEYHPNLCKNTQKIIDRCQEMMDSDDYTMNTDIDEKSMADIECIFEGLEEDERIINYDWRSCFTRSADVYLPNIRLLGIEEDYFNPCIQMYSRQEAITALKGVMRILEDNEKHAKRHASKNNKQKEAI